MSDLYSCISMALYYIDLFLPEAVLVIGSPLNFFFFATLFVQNPFQFSKIDFTDIQNCKHSLFIIKLEQIIIPRQLKVFWQRYYQNIKNIFLTNIATSWLDNFIMEK